MRDCTQYTLISGAFCDKKNVGGLTEVQFISTADPTGSCHKVLDQIAQEATCAAGGQAAGCWLLPW